MKKRKIGKEEVRRFERLALALEIVDVRVTELADDPFARERVTKLLTRGFGIPRHQFEEMVSVALDCIEAWRCSPTHAAGGCRRIKALPTLDQLDRRRFETVKIAARYGRWPDN